MNVMIGPKHSCIRKLSHLIKLFVTYIEMTKFLITLYNVIENRN